VGGGASSASRAARASLACTPLIVSTTGTPVNPEYGGDEIGEYEFYADGQWDAGTCANETACTRMDCHDPYASSWEQLGVYKETVSFENE
jgi:hypothetical protein